MVSIEAGSSFQARFVERVYKQEILIWDDCVKLGTWLKFKSDCRYGNHKEHTYGKLRQLDINVSEKMRRGQELIAATTVLATRGLQSNLNVHESKTYLIFSNQHNLIELYLDK